jgi:hypothetical protein
LRLRVNARETSHIKPVVKFSIVSRASCPFGFEYSDRSARSTRSTRAEAHATTARISGQAQTYCPSNQHAYIIPPMSASKRALWKPAAYIIACIAMDVFPKYGPPTFRYNGSDPEFNVWNLGWPLPNFIYDPRSGFHIGPSAYPVILAQIFSLAAIVLIRTVFRSRQRKILAQQ